MEKNGTNHNLGLLVDPWNVEEYMEDGGTLTLWEVADDVKER